MGKLSGDIVSEGLSLARRYLDGSAYDGDLYEWCERHMFDPDAFEDTPLRDLYHTIYGGLSFVDIGELTQEAFKQELRNLLAKYSAARRHAHVARG